MNGKLAAAKIYEGFVSKTTCAFAFISSVLYTFFRTVMLLGWAVKYQKADFTHGELIWKETKGYQFWSWTSVQSCSAKSVIKFFCKAGATVVI